MEGGEYEKTSIIKEIIRKKLGERSGERGRIRKKRV